jgi:hypothetical protein
MTQAEEQIQGSLHCAGKDEAVPCFGREDVLFCGARDPSVERTWFLGSTPETHVSKARHGAPDQREGSAVSLALDTPPCDGETVARMGHPDRS